MARGINKVIVIGNLGADPETRYTPSGSTVTRLSVATNEEWTDRNSGERQSRTEWHRVVLFGKVAEIAAQYLAKGRSVYIEGSLRTNKWTDQNGVDRYTTEIIGNEMQMLGGDGGGQGAGGSRPASQNGAPASADRAAPPAGKTKTAVHPQPAESPTGYQAGGTPDPSFDPEDIPF